MTSTSPLSSPWIKATASSREVKNSSSCQYEELRPVLKRGYKEIGLGKKVRSYTGRIALCLLALGILAFPGMFWLYGPWNDDDFYCGPDGAAYTPLGIDYAFGNFSFTAAKSIDAAWNLVVGHGGQFVLTWISYKVFIPSLYRIAEQSLVPIDSYTDIALFGPQMRSLWSILIALKSTKGRRPKAILSFMVFVSVFVLAWPTLLDVTTGYIPRQTTMLTLDNDYLVPFSYDDWIDGTRAVTYCNQTLTAQDLWGIDSYGDFEAEGPDVNFYGNFPPFICIPDGRFKWGFSTILISITTVLLNVWAWGLFGLWADSFKYSQIYHQIERPGTYRVILDIADAIMTLMGPRAAVSSNKKLEEEFQRSKVKLKWHSASTAQELPTLRAHIESE